MKINADLLKKINEAETNYEKLNTIVKGWCQSSKNLDKMIASQIPAQTKAILGNDINSTLESSLSSILEADDLSDEVLPNTFKTNLDGRQVKTNRFVRAEGSSVKTSDPVVQSDRFVKHQSTTAGLGYTSSSSHSSKNSYVSNQRLSVAAKGKGILKMPDASGNNFY